MKLKPNISLSTGPKIKAELPVFNFDICEPIPESKPKVVTFQDIKKSKRVTNSLF